MDPYTEFFRVLEETSEQQIIRFQHLASHFPDKYYLALVKAIRYKPVMHVSALQTAALIALEHLNDWALEDTVYSLSEISDTDFILRLKPFLTPANPFRTRLILLFLQQQPDCPELVPFIESLTNVAQIKLSAALTLTIWGHLEQLPILIDGIEERNSTEKIRIFSTLRDYSDILSVKKFLLKKLISSRSNFIQGLAAGAMTKATEHHPFLLKTIEKKNCSEWVRWNIRQALKNQPKP